jgi:hypothetical protein
MRKMPSMFLLVFVLVCPAFFGCHAEQKTPPAGKDAGDEAAENAKKGIARVYLLKKAFDGFERECAGYPIRTLGGDADELLRIIDRQPPAYPLGLPQTYPTSRMCDAVSLMDFINTDLKKPVCNASDAECLKKAGGDAADFNSLFVEDSGGPGNVAGNCSVSGKDFISGWNYVLLTNPSAPMERPVPVVCANVYLKDGKSVTVVVNSEGTARGHNVPDGAGMFGPDGAGLPNACPCGAWCSNNITGETGCCDTCTDSAGKSRAGMKF